MKKGGIHNEKYNKYFKKGYKLLKEMGEDKIVSEIDSGNYMSFCPWE